MTPTEMRDIQVLVVDDHRVFSDAIRMVLDGRPGIASVDTVESGEAAVERCRTAPPDVVLMDVSLPGIDGLEATRELRRSSPGTAVVVITALGDEELLGSAVRAGALGIVSKTRSPEDIVEVVRRAANGEELEPFGRSKLKGEPRSEPAPADLETLTDRELEILRAVAEGRSTRELAAALRISPLTVESHLKSIYVKLGVHSRIEAITLAWRSGLMSGSRTA